MSISHCVNYSEQKKSFCWDLMSILHCVNVNYRKSKKGVRILPGFYAHNTLCECDLLRTNKNLLPGFDVHLTLCDCELLRIEKKTFVRVLSPSYIGWMWMWTTENPTTKKNFARILRPSYVVWMCHCNILRTKKNLCLDFLSLLHFVLYKCDLEENEEKAFARILCPSYVTWMWISEN